jgi:S1-C subfamily serine protease
LVWIEDPRYGIDEADPDAPDSGPPGMRGNGSGWFVSADGYIITNRHVAESDDGYYYRIRLSTKDEEGNFIEYPARFVAADDEYDIALLKVEHPDGEEFPYFHVLEEDVPPIQADVMTAGYPTVGTGNFVFQTARGTVSSNDTNDELYDIYLDMKTTQGNSGGPIFDRNGHVIGITTAYRKVFDSIVSLAVGPRQIRDFLSDLEEKPDLEYDTETDRPFDAVSLAEEVQPKTVLVLIFAGEADDLEASEGNDESSDDNESPNDEDDSNDDDLGEGDEE